MVRYWISKIKNFMRNSFFRWRIPFGYQKIKKHINIENFKILDIGCGNHSPSKAKFYFPQCIYHGLDKKLKFDNNEFEKRWNNSNNDIISMSNFFEIDLTGLKFSSIPDNYYDIIYMSHVIEHLFNGERVILELLKKSNIGGIFYLEYPSYLSTNLNFYSDPTHCRIYSAEKLINILTRNKEIKIIDYGRKIYLKDILFFPLFLILDITLHKILHRTISYCPFYGILGCTEYILFKKTA